MSYEVLRRRFSVLVGPDVLVSFDDDEMPSQIMLYRYDEVADDLMRSAIGRIADEFPREMKSIRDVFMSFEARLGPTRRRFALQ